MNKNFSVPSLASNWSSGFQQDLLPRRRSTTDVLFKDLSLSPLHDLAPVAIPGLMSRVSRNNSVALSLDGLTDAFNLAPSADTCVTIEGGYTASLVWAAGVAVLSAMQYGYNLGNMNTAAAAMRDSLGIPSIDPNGLASPDNDNIWGFCVSIFCLGALAGCSLGASLSDQLGRKRMLLGSSIVYALGGVLEAGSCLLGSLGGVSLMLVGRVVTGVACGASTVVVPMYLGEISPPHLRGTLGTCFQLCCVVAMLVAQVLGLPALMGTEALWPAYLLLVLVPAGAQLMLRDRLLESPRWLAGRGPDEAMEAQHILAALRGASLDDVAVVKELDFMQMGQANRELEIPGHSYGISQMLRDRSTRAGLKICMTCMAAQQFCGINNAFNFSSTFLTQNGISAATVTAIAVLMNVGNVLVTLLSVWLMDRAGRRVLLLGSSVAMVAAILLLTLALSNPGQVWTSPLAVVSVVSFVMAFGIGMGPVPWLLPAELFAMDKCAKGSGIAAGANWLANFIVVQAFPALSNSLHGLCFVPFAVVLVLFVWFAALQVPETRGKTLDQILEEIGAGRTQTKSDAARARQDRYMGGL